jgi:hypothetical protein
LRVTSGRALVSMYLLKERNSRSVDTTKSGGETIN